ncbi:FecCD family ABC transporter permease [Thermovenabulum sp.]|uniref:FecCD family ABC transporter permease n=1 Tax=Thermovenabulum sp. TaxID=3100335 RepID=UPI003C7D86DF
MFRKISKKYIYFLLLLLIFLGSVISISMGAFYIPEKKIPLILLSLFTKREYNFTFAEKVIILNFRLPRIILSFLVGAELSCAGVIYQGMFRNPLTDPYVIGASSGASLGASLAILYFQGMNFLGMNATPFFSFLGALFAVFLVWSIARIGGKTLSFSILLSGIAVSSFLSAIVSFLMYASGEKLKNIYFWHLGSFSYQGWKEVIINLPYGITGFLAGFFILRGLNVLQLGEETAFFTGVDVELLKKLCLISASLLTASAVAFCGIIGFVGLIIPHISRLIIGPDHRNLYVFSALFGGLYLMVMDTLSRVIIAPSEMPVGIITALVGGPFFLYLLIKNKKIDFS